MKNYFVLLGLLFFTCFASGAMANCADNAINTCNKKHPDPDKSDHAYGLYELCIKAQIGKHCPKNSAAGKMVLRDIEKSRKGITPRCPAGYDLRVDWKGRVDWCMKSKTRYFRNYSR